MNQKFYNKFDLSWDTELDKAIHSRMLFYFSNLFYISIIYVYLSISIFITIKGIFFYPHFIIRVLFLVILKINYFINNLFLIIFLQISFVLNY